MRLYHRVRLWDLTTRRVSRIVGGWKSGEAYAVDSIWLGDAPSTVPVTVIGSNRGALVRVLKQRPNKFGRLGPRRDGLHKNWVSSVVCTEFEDHLIAVTTGRQGVQGWDLVSQRQIFAFDTGGKGFSVACTNLGGKLVVLTTGPGPVCGWDPTSGRRIFRLDSTELVGTVTCAVLGSTPVAITGDEDGLVRIWDLQREADRALELLTK